MKWGRKIISLGLGLAMVLGVVGRVWAADEIIIHFFWSVSCPHCLEAKPFLESLENKYEWVELMEHEVSKASSVRLWQKVGKALGANVGGTPFTVIGDQFVSGYLDDQSTGAQIEGLVLKAKAEDWPDVVSEIMGVKQGGGQAVKLPSDKGIPDKLKLPLIGEVGLRGLSLPMLTVGLGLVDGFNPCAMWALLFLISLLLGMKDRKRMWLLGGVFIGVSGLLYFLIMAAWLNLFLLVGLLSWVRLGIGLFAIGAGGFHLRKWWQDRQGGCEAEESEKQQQVFGKLKKAALNQNLWLALLGISSLAIAVNLVEFMCSAGLPAIFTSILAVNQLSSWKYYLYILLYVFIFMLDDLLVFMIAMVTLKAVGIESKYASWSRVIGGIIMLLIGFAMIFRPEWLMFG